MKIILLITLLAIGGISAARPRRAVGGQLIPSEMAASFVSIRLNHVHICGGALISNKIVLTMARCVVDVDSKRLRKLSVKTASSITKGDDRRYKIRRIVCSVYKKKTSTIGPTSIVALILTEKIPSFEDIKPIEVTSNALGHIQLSMPRVPLVAQLVTFNSKKMETSEYPIERLSVEIDSPVKHLWSLDHREGASVPGFHGKALNGKLSEGDIGSPLIYNEVLIGLVREQKPSNEKRDIYVDVYECSKFITNVLFKETSSYIVL